MAGAIGPGDWVEFVGAENAKLPALVRGSIHVVADVEDGAGLCSCGDDGPAIILRGFEHVWHGCCSSCEVRPIYRPRADIIEALKAPAPERERESA